MRLEQMIYCQGEWQGIPPSSNPECNLILCFGQKRLLKQLSWYDALRITFPKAAIVAASTAGEITNSGISDDSIVVTAITFEKSVTRTVKINIADYGDGLVAGRDLAAKIEAEDLRFVLILSDGSLVNGGDLVMGINDLFDNEIAVAGGLAGDGPDFVSTVVGYDDDLGEGNIVAIGFYGEHLKIGFGSDGGWSSFGPTRKITKSSKNVVYEIDGINALDLYMKYLGDFADRLPGSALLFPLSLVEEGKDAVVRTILGIDKEEKSMTFAGNMPEGGKVRLMKTTIDRLVDAASSAAEKSISSQDQVGDKLAILISCVGRKLVFGNRLDEELEAVRHSMGDDAMICGFYSYGEIAPYSDFIQCQLHNQTMTITTIAEV